MTSRAAVTLRSNGHCRRRESSSPQGISRFEGPKPPTRVTTRAKARFMRRRCAIAGQLSLVNLRSRLQKGKPHSLPRMTMQSSSGPFRTRSARSRHNWADARCRQRPAGRSAAGAPAWVYRHTAVVGPEHRRSQQAPLRLHDRRDGSTRHERQPTRSCRRSRVRVAG